MLAQNGELMQVVAVTVICVNILLSALQKVLLLIKDKTKTKADNKAYIVISQILGAMAQVVDWASANRKH